MSSNVLIVTGARRDVAAFRVGAVGPGIGPFIPSSPASMRIIELVQSGLRLRQSATIVRQAFQARLTLPSAAGYARWRRRQIRLAAGERRTWERQLRRASRHPIPLDLFHLSPLPESVAALGEDAVRAWLIAHWDTKWNAWDVSVDELEPLRGGLARLRYSFLTAWSPPVNAIITASRTYPDLCFVVAASEDDAFWSVFVHRGRSASWEIPDRVVRKNAEMETDEESGERYIAGIQPRLFDLLESHWDPVVKRTLVRLRRSTEAADR